MKSMTGYGKGAAAEALREVTVELRCVNNRFLEVSTRLPKSLLACDEYLRGIIPKYVKRGTVDVFFNYANSEKEESPDADIQLIKKYFDLAKKIQDETSVPNNLNFTSLLKQQGLITTGVKDDDAEAVLRLTAKAALEALDALEKMRLKEGEAIKLDLVRLIKEIAHGLSLATNRAPLAVEEYRAKLHLRISEALSAVAVDEAKLLNEVAFFADRADINEEIQRLNSHIDLFLAELEKNEPIGRKLDFICQEMGREINTMGSKSNDITLTGIVVEMKNSLEKIKEQIRNVE